MNKRIKPIAFLTLAIIGCSILTVNTASAQIKKTVVHHSVTTKTTTLIHSAKKPSAAEIAEGKALFTKSDCLTCHKMDVKLVGPAYYDVAKKYPATDANYETLANKVVSGGSGNWGTIPMAPHANLSHADAKKIVEYVLSLKPGKS